MSTSTQHITDLAGSADRRQNPRTTPHSLIYVAFGGSNGGMVLNASDDGLAISTAIGVGDDAFSQMNVRMNGLPESIEVSGRMAWTAKSKKRAGIQLLGVDDTQRAKIREWIALEGIRDVDLTPAKPAVADENVFIFPPPVSSIPASPSFAPVPRPPLFGAASTEEVIAENDPIVPEARTIGEPEPVVSNAPFAGAGRGASIEPEFLDSPADSLELPGNEGDRRGFRNQEWDLASVSRVEKRRQSGSRLSALALALWIAIPSFAIGMAAGPGLLKKWGLQSVAAMRKTAGGVGWQESSKVPGTTVGGNASHAEETVAADDNARPVSEGPDFGEYGYSATRRPGQILPDTSAQYAAPKSAASGVSPEISGPGTQLGSPLDRSEQKSLRGNAELDPSKTISQNNGASQTGNNNYRKSPVSSTPAQPVVRRENRPPETGNRVATEAASAQNRKENVARTNPAVIASEKNYRAVNSAPSAGRSPSALSTNVQPTTSVAPDSASRPQSSATATVPVSDNRRDVRVGVFPSSSEVSSSASKRGTTPGNPAAAPTNASNATANSSNAQVGTQGRQMSGSAVPVAPTTQPAASLPVSAPPIPNKASSGPASPSISNVAPSTVSPQPVARDVAPTLRPSGNSSSPTVNSDYTPTMQRGVVMVGRKSNESFVLQLPSERVAASQSLGIRFQRSILVPQQKGWFHKNSIAKLELGALAVRVPPERGTGKNGTRAGDEVSVKIFVDKNGRVQDMKPVSGRFALVPRVMRAVREWRFEPTLLDGKAVESEVKVTVDFR